MGLDSISHMQQMHASTGQAAMLGVETVKRAVTAGNNALDAAFQAKDKADSQVMQAVQGVPGRVDTWA